MISGSIGMLASASLAGSSLGLYEPIHGSAPDIAGQGVANPLGDNSVRRDDAATIPLTRRKAANAIEAAVDEALRRARTPDIKAEGLPVVSTAEMGDLVAGLITER